MHFSSPVQAENKAMVHVSTFPPYFLNFVQPCDTVYVLGDKYLEVSLEKQNVILHYRDGRQITYPVSSGNKLVKDAMETPTGIFSVQGKSPLAISKQYNDAKMYWWIGFDGNIGFHGLEGTGYYRHLGKHPSSHGCLRVGREDIQELYKQVTLGTPVIVYKTTPARILAFVDTAYINLTKGIALASRTKQQTAFLQKRLERLYTGKYFVTVQPPVYLDGKTRLRPGGYETGAITSVPLSHEKPLLFSFASMYAVRDRFSRPSCLYPFAPEENMPAQADTTIAKADTPTAVAQVSHRKEKH